MISESLKQFATTFDEWREIAETHNHGRRWCPESNSKAWSIRVFAMEIVARGLKIGDIADDDAMAALVLARLHEWYQSRMNFHILHSIRENPRGANVAQPDQQSQLLGFIAAHPQESRKEADRIANFFAAATDSERQVFFDEGRKGFKVGRWKYPELDSWLVMVWPLVRSDQWNWHDIYHVALERFPEPPDTDRFLDNPERLKEHAKDSLGDFGLIDFNAFTGSKGAPRKDIPRPFMADFAIQFPLGFPSDSPFLKTGG